MSYIIAAFTVLFFVLILTLPAATQESPAFAEITQILGPNNVGLRINGQVKPADVEDRMGPSPDALYLPGDSRTFVDLDFYDRSGQHTGTRVQVRTRNDLPTLYYFPCTINLGGPAVIEWANQDGGERGCETGFRVDRSTP